MKDPDDRWTILGPRRRSDRSGRSSDFPSFSAAFPHPNFSTVAYWGWNGSVGILGCKRRGSQRRARPRFARGSLL